MAIYIKGMEMPKNCGECKFHRPLYHTQFCMILDKNCSPWQEQKAWCPLTEVPEPSAEAEQKMTEEVREALMRLTMCAREECGMCKYKDKCGFEFQYNISTENMNTLLEALSADAVQGEWEHWGSPFSDESEVIDTIVCSVCGARFIEPKDEPKGEYNFCPNCGARMKGGAE